MRIAIGLEYDGTAYNGWQRQRSGTGIQALVEDALSSVANEPVEVHCAGRTDAGVHASGQVAHFDTRISRTQRGWLLGANSNLPDDINLRWVEFVDDRFHARYAAASRTYRYLILNRVTRSALWRNRVWWVQQPLDELRMQSGAEQLVGEHDFSAFRASGCQASTPMREVKEVTVVRSAEWLTITITANAFLQHMVRNIVGLLVAIGSGGESPDWAGEVLASRDRTIGGVAAPAQGLTLFNVTYPDEFGLPRETSYDAVL